MTGQKKKKRYGNKNVRSISPTFVDLKEKLGINEKLEIHSVLQKWKAVVGERLGPHVHPLYIKDRVLYVKCDGAVWMQEFNFAKGDTIRKLNLEFGRPLVKDIRFRN